MIVKFKRKIAFLLLFLYCIAAVLILFILNYSYVQNNRQNVSGILNMKSHMASMQTESMQPKEDKISESPRKGEDVHLSDSYIDKSYLVIKEEDETFHVDYSVSDRAASEGQTIEIAENILKTKETTGNYQNYQFEITVGNEELLIGFADITSVKKKEQRYAWITVLIALAGCGIWIYPAWKIAGRMVAPLEEAIRLQEEFVMFAGHELKTPVTVMKASLDMMRKDGVRSKYLDYVEEENEKMKKLVIDLLDYSKLEYRKRDMQTEKINLSECIESTALEFEAMAFEKGIEFSTDIEENIHIMGNADHLQRMTETLIENGMGHTEKGNEVQVHLKKDGKKVYLWIQNQGEEIPEKDREKIFEKFYRLPDADDCHYGLGLAIAQTIADLHHTKIRVVCKNGWNRFQMEFLNIG